MGAGEELQELQEWQQHKPSVGREPRAAASSRLRKAPSSPGVEMRQIPPGAKSLCRISSLLGGK